MKSPSITTVSVHNRNVVLLYLTLNTRHHSTKEERVSRAYEFTRH